MRSYSNLRIVYCTKPQPDQRVLARRNAFRQAVVLRSSELSVDGPADGGREGLPEGPCDVSQHTMGQAGPPWAVACLPASLLHSYK